MKRDTICALCTSKGKGAVSLIRISGPKSLEITRKLAGFLPLKPESHKAYFGILKQNSEPLDQVLITYFAEGRSFTGEETLEISCHGGGIYNDVLKALLSSGARLAERGEFSFQAFSNGKMDLVQAEGLLQLIESRNDIVRRQAFAQLTGELSRALKEIEKKWLFLLSHIEADIDFSLEGLDTFKEDQIKALLQELQTKLLNILSCYKPFENLQKGLVFGIFGPVNSGKSSLFNALLKEDKAIVSKEEGTTRDLVEGQLLNPQSLNICLKDSAGFRKSESEGEIKGQAKSRELFLSCDYRIVAVDLTCFERPDLDENLLKDSKRTLFVFTKKDLLKKDLTRKELIKSFKKMLTTNVDLPEEQVFLVSSLTGEGVDFLRTKILSYGEINQEEFLVSNYRHYKGLKIMEESLEECLLILQKAQGERDIMALALRRGLVSLYEILGKQIEDKVLDKIFKEFCIGK